MGKSKTYSVGITIDNFDPWFLINDIGKWSKDKSVTIFWSLSFWMFPADFHSLTTNEFSSDSQVFWSKNYF